MEVGNGARGPWGDRGRESSVEGEVKRERSAYKRRRGFASKSRTDAMERQKVALSPRGTQLKPQIPLRGFKLAFNFAPISFEVLRGWKEGVPFQFSSPVSSSLVPLRIFLKLLDSRSTPYFDVKRRSNIALDKLVSETESQHRDGPVMDNDESTGREVKKKTQKRDVKTGNQ
uniref:Uncharacterized protein n=1 Tax=Vespula pensylvanica TaxID=30213 RepID=A0A834P2L3_VESPE|nr:hypothetical protein H0235_008123 [Vespula pensylvanica]